MKYILEQEQWVDQKEINPCIMEKEKVIVLNKLLENDTIISSRIKTICPNFRIYIHNWSDIDENLKEEILKLL